MKGFFKGLLVALSLLLSACGGDKASSTENELSLFMINDGVPFDESFEVFQEAERQTDIKVTAFNSRSNVDLTQAYSLMIASGNLADIISYDDIGALESLGNSGGLIPLNNLIEKHAPDMKEFFEKYPRFRKDAYSADGDIYAIPFYFDYHNLRTAKMFFLRTDWLKEMGLDMPETMGELKEILLTFKKANPSYIPYFSRSVNIDLDLLPIFGAHPRFYEEDGVIKFGPYEKEFQLAMEDFQEWYRLGIIDEEIFTRGRGARDSLLSSNLGGSTSDWAGSTASYNDVLNTEIEGFEFKAIAPVSFDDGRKVIFYSRNSTNGKGWGISSACEDPITAIKYMNFWFTEEGRRLYNFGLEGKHYEVVDGELEFTEYLTNHPSGQPVNILLQQSGAQLSVMGAHQDGRYENNFISDAAKEGVEIYMSDIEYMTEPLPMLKFTNDEVREMNRIMTDIDTYISETVQRWTMNSNIDVAREIEGFNGRLEDLGVKKAIEINQAALDRYNSF